MSQGATMLKEHKELMDKVGDYVLRADKSLHPEDCGEKCCSFFNWIKNLDSEDDLQELKKVHRQFHLQLGELILNANRGVAISEDMALGPHSPLNRYLESFQKQLTKIKRNSPCD